MAFCVECGTKIENNEMICSYCGKEMKTEQNAKQELLQKKSVASITLLIQRRILM